MNEIGDVLVFVPQAEAVRQRLGIVAVGLLAAVGYELERVRVGKM